MGHVECRAVKTAVLCGILALTMSGCPSSSTEEPASPEEQSAPEARPSPAQQEPAKSLSGAEAARAVQLLNVGLAHLENEQLSDAVDNFRALAKVAPGELPPVRNLLVAQVLGIAGLGATSDRPKLDARLSEAEVTLARMRTLDPDSVATKVLSARLEIGKGDEAAAMAELQAATRRDPDDVPTWYEQHSLGSVSRDEGLAQDARTALDRAYQLSPTNLVLLLERLKQQLEQQDPTIIETLQSGQSRWKQLQPGLKKRLRIDLLALVKAAEESVEAGDWNLINGRVRPIINVVAPESATKSDRRLVNRHALEFVLDQLSQPIMAASAKADRGDSPLPLAFKTVDDSRLASLSNVSDLFVADFDLDGLADTAILRDNGEFQVLLGDADHPDEMLTVIAAGTTQFRAFDVDDDVERDAPLPVDPDDGHPVCHRADLDLLMFGPETVQLFRNAKSDTGRQWESIELPEGLSTAKSIIDVIPADLDRDGDLDLVVLTEAGVRLWSNLGNVTFAETFRVNGMPEEMQATAALPIDWDQDLDLDVVLTDSKGRLGFLENLLYGAFQWRAMGDVGLSVTSIEPLDRNGSWDLFVGGVEGLRRVRTSTPARGRIDIESIEPVSTTPVQELRTADLDNDGWLDVIAVGPTEIIVWRGRSDGRLAEPHSVIEDSPSMKIVAVEVADVDADGQVDLFVSDESTTVVLLNECGVGQGSLDVSLLAEQVKSSGDLSASGRVNHYGIGSVLEIRNGAGKQRQLVRRPVEHFGLGGSAQADAVRVLWTNGVPENIIQPKSLTFICERQTLKGSCPYLYGWNGEQLTFITDLLWAAPIGLVGPNGDLVPTRPWEHLKIDGEQLTVRGGRYELRITEELWEAAYFDSVRLFAVDHPAEVDFFTNEKVGPPHMAEHRLHPVRQRHWPVAAVDQAGRDVLPLISEVDDRYVKLFDVKHKQGYTEPTTLELDFGELNDALQITLLLTGWIYPTDTTINVALSQNLDDVGPQTLSLAVPDADGQWQTVIPYTGFPGGKTKTVAIDLTGRFLTNDYRVRLSTSMELYWDAAFVTIDELPAEFREIELTLAHAELRTRGVSARISHPQFGPERYDYDDVSPSPWVAMEGRFTRLGDVRELLAADDSRLVVMGSGDEIVIEFESIDPPPQGWTRDFVLRNVGWDKDADLHTIYGQSSEPLPFLEMSAYPSPLDESPPADAVYSRYLREYQQRTMPLRRW